MREIVDILLKSHYIDINNIPRNAIIGVELRPAGNSRYFIEKINGQYFLSGMETDGSNFNNTDMYNTREEMIKEYMERDYKLYVFDTPRELYQWMAEV